MEGPPGGVASALGRQACVRAEHMNQLDASSLPRAMLRGHTEATRSKDPGPCGQTRKGRHRGAEGLAKGHRSLALQPGLDSGRRPPRPNSPKSSSSAPPRPRPPPTPKAGSPPDSQLCPPDRPPQTPEPPESTWSTTRGRAKAAFGDFLLAGLQACEGGSCGDAPGEERPQSCLADGGPGCGGGPADGERAELPTATCRRTRWGPEGHPGKGPL